MKKKFTITLTLSESINNIEELAVNKEDIITPWVPIIVGCLEAYSDEMTESLVVNRDRIIKITPSGGVTYVNQIGLLMCYDPARMKLISTLCSRLKSSPKISPNNFSMCEIRIMLEALRNVNNAIGEGTDKEVIKHVPFAMMHSTLLDALETAAAAHVLCDDNSEHVSKDTKEECNDAW